MMTCTNPTLPLLCWATLVLAGCSHTFEERADDIKDAQERYRQILERQQETPPLLERASRVEVPREQAWLYRAYRATYSRRPLRDALRSIVPGLPITYALEQTYNPPVSSTPHATTIEDHLDNIALQANVGYLVRHDALLITPTVTRRYEVPLYGGGQNFMTLSHNNLGRDESAPGNFSNSINTSISLLEDVSRLVNTTLGITPCEEGQQGTDPETRAAPAPTRPYTRNDLECYNVAASGNLLTITARPQRLALFDDAYKNWLKSVTRQANIKVTTIRLDVSDLARESVDLSIIRNASIGATLSNITQDLVGAASISGGGSALTISIDSDTSPWRTSSIVIEALASIGNVSIEDSRELLLFNNRLATIRDYTIYPYIEQISIARTDSGGTSQSTPTVKTKELAIGQALNILPTLTDDMIALHLVINEAQITDFQEYAILDTSGTLPHYSGSDSVFDVKLQHNQAVLLATTTRTENSLSKDRSGLLPFWPFTQLGQNARQGRRRTIQTLFLIEANYQP